MSSPSTTSGKFFRNSTGEKCAVAAVPLTIARACFSDLALPSFFLTVFESTFGYFVTWITLKFFIYVFGLILFSFYRFDEALFAKQNTSPDEKKEKK